MHHADCVAPGYDVPDEPSCICAQIAADETPQEPAHVPVSGPDTPRPVGADPAKCRRVCVACNAGQHESCGWASCHPDGPVSPGAGSGSEALRARLAAVLLDNTSLHGFTVTTVLDALLPLIEADREAYASEREEQARAEGAEQALRDAVGATVNAEPVFGHHERRVLVARADAVRDAREAL